MPRQRNLTNIYRWWCQSQCDVHFHPGIMELSLDMSVALRSCPKQSWVNPAKQIMSILNLALQRCSLERAKMSDVFEQKMELVSSVMY